MFHCYCRVAWGIACKFTLIEGLYEFSYCLVTDFSCGEFLGDILACQLLYRYSEFVTHISPQGTQHFVIELIRLAGLKQLGCYLQAFCCYLVGFLSTICCDVCQFHSTTAEDYQQYDEYCQHNAVEGEICRTAKEGILWVFGFVATNHEVMDILITLLRIVCCRAPTPAFRYFQRHRFCGKSFIG